tara:strand:+ start:231 stop:878 length:648 start_codon:yes stop_codon:yes gene_type:complete
MIRFDLNALPIVSEDATFTFNKKEISFIEKLEYKKTHNVTIPDCGVKVSKTENVFKHKELKRVKNFILNKVKEYRNNVLEINNKLKCVQSWTTYNVKGTSHHLHAHPNTFISLVYYVKCPEQGGDILFELPKSRLQEGFNFNYNIKNFNIYNSTTWRIITKTGKIVIFPGWVPHMSTPQEVDDKRIILGANFFLEGVVGEINNHDLIDISLNEVI